MACPVNSPWFHALVFLLGVLVVLTRYARAASPPPTLQPALGGAASLVSAAAPATWPSPLSGELVDAARASARCWASVALGVGATGWRQAVEGARTCLLA